MYDYGNIASQIVCALEKKDNKGIVLYCANQIAQNIIYALAKKHGIAPLCICDSNEALWHTRLSGVEIISIDEAKARFGAFLIYIANERYLYEITGWLLENGKTTQGQILNYVPMAKKISCDYLNGTCVNRDDGLYFCCSNFGRNSSPSVLFNGNYEETIDAFFALRTKTIRELNEGIPNTCTGCRDLKMGYWPDEQSVNIQVTDLIHNGGGICNFRCEYCVASAKNNKSAETKMNFTKLVDVLRANNCLSSKSTCQMVSGEITIHPERDTLYNVMRTFYFNRIFTNAMLYDETISEFLSSNRGCIIVSIDAGTRETFKKIKGVDAYDQVCNTLSRYAKESHDAIFLKYILFPGINDNETDVDGFITLARAIRPIRVFISLDWVNAHNANDNVFRIAEYFSEQASEHSIICETNSDIIAESTAIVKTY